MVRLTRVCLVALAWAAGAHGPAIAADREPIEYQIKAGDTLSELAERYFVDQRAASVVQKINGISNERRLRIGRVIEVPVELLRYEDVPLRVLSFAGPVNIVSASRAITPSIGIELKEGTIVATGERGFISLGGTGNSRVSLPSNSRVRVRGARRYLLDNSLDFDLRVLRGRSEIVAPKLREGERYRVGTPMAVTAVRGTEFRVAFDEESNLALTEVVEGTVEVSAGDSALVTEAGSGVATSLAGLGQSEKLLHAPDIIEPGELQTAKDVRFAIEPISGSSTYRTQIAKDAGFVEVIAETVSPADAVVFSEVEDGRLFVRARAIAESGLEGLTQAYSFRRKRVGVSAAVEPSPFDDAYKFAWLPEGAGTSFAAFQMWKADEPDTLIVDEVGLDVAGLYISDITPGDYGWRVATFQIDDGDVIKVWGPVQALSITE